MTVAAPTFRPRNLAELLDSAIRLYRRNFLTFVGIIAVIQVPVGLIQLLLSLLTFDGAFLENLQNLQDPDFLLTANPADIFGPGFYIGAIGSVCFSFIALILIQGVATAATTRSVADHYLGQPTTILDAYRKIGRTWLPLVIALILAIILGIIFFIWGLVPCIGWLTGIGLFFFWMFAVIPLIAPIVVLEDQTITGAIRRAWDLARRRFWGLLGFVFILFILGQLVITMPVTIMSWLMQLVLGDSLFAPTTTTFTVQAIVQSLTTLGFSLIYLPLQITGITLMYFDLRIRTEGIDLTLAAESGSSTSPTSIYSNESADDASHQTTISEIIAQAPKPEQSSLMTKNELKNVVLVSLLGGGGFLILFTLLAAFGALLGLLLGAQAGF